MLTLPLDNKVFTRTLYARVKETGVLAYRACSTKIGFTRNQIRDFTLFYSTTRRKSYTTGYFFLHDSIM